MPSFDFSAAQAVASMAEGQQASVPIQSLLMQINTDAVCLVRSQFQQFSLQQPRSAPTLPTGHVLIQTSGTCGCRFLLLIKIVATLAAQRAVGLVQHRHALTPLFVVIRCVRPLQTPDSASTR